MKKVISTALALVLASSTAFAGGLGNALDERVEIQEPAGALVVGDEVVRDNTILYVVAIVAGIALLASSMDSTTSTTDDL